jgi:hemoglobin
MYEQVGGEPRLRELCEKFHQLVVADPLLGEMFAYSGRAHVEHLVLFFCEMFGGPAKYSKYLGGIDGLYDAHLELAITELQRARFVELMLTAAREAGLPDDERFTRLFTRYIEAGSMFSLKFSQPEAAAADRPTFPAIDPWTWDEE